MSLLVLGVGLEQDLLKNPSNFLWALYITGNFVGLALGVFTYRLFPNKWASKIWLFTGLLLVSLVWKQTPVNMFGLGCCTGLLFLYLCWVFKEAPCPRVHIPVGLGITAGNILLLLLKKLPWPLGLVFTSLLFAYIQVLPSEERSETYLDNYISTFKKINFLLFLFLTNFLSGFYYSFILNEEYKSYFYYSIYTFAYAIAVFLVLKNFSKLFRWIPVICVTLLGLSLSLQLPLDGISVSSLIIIVFIFGILDVFAVTYIFLYFQTPLEYALGFGVFLLGTILSTGLFFHIDLTLQYQCGFLVLFFNIFPAILCTRGLNRSKQKIITKDIGIRTPTISLINIFNHKLAESCKLKNNSKRGEQEKGTGESLGHLYKEKASLKIAVENDINSKELEVLSKREKEVFFYLIQGYKLKDIASQMNLALGTIKSITSRIYEKLRVENKKDLLNRYKTIKKSEKIDDNSELSW